MITFREAKDLHQPKVVERYECNEANGERVTISLRGEDIFWGTTEMILEKTDNNESSDC